MEEENTESCISTCERAENSAEMKSKKSFSKSIRNRWQNIRLMVNDLKQSSMEAMTPHKKLKIKDYNMENTVGIVTGASRGIGAEVVKLMLKMDMHVIMGVRQPGLAQDLVEGFRASGINTGKATIYHLDLLSLNSVETFAKKVIDQFDNINILINNAGVINPNRCLTEDGHESQLQVNYLSHFLLTKLLLPSLKNSGCAEKPSRIINVTSTAAYGAKINFKDVNLTNGYTPQIAYAQSKLMQVADTRRLNNMMRKDKALVKAFAVHPGFIDTALYQPTSSGKSKKSSFKSVEQGAETIVYAAVSPKSMDKDGCFLVNSKVRQPPPKAKSKSLQQKLWQLSSELIEQRNIYNVGNGEPQSDHDISRRSSVNSGAHDDEVVEEASQVSNEEDVPKICDVAEDEDEGYGNNSGTDHNDDNEFSGSEHLPSSTYGIPHSISEQSLTESDSDDDDNVTNERSFDTSFQLKRHRSILDWFTDEGFSSSMTEYSNQGGNYGGKPKEKFFMFASNSDFMF